MTSLAWEDGELAASDDPDEADRLLLAVDGRRIGSIVTYASLPGSWQRIHGFGAEEELWSFDIELDDDADRGRGLPAPAALGFAVLYGDQNGPRNARPQPEGSTKPHADGSQTAAGSRARSGEADP